MLLGWEISEGEASIWLLGLSSPRPDRARLLREEFDCGLIYCVRCSGQETGIGCNETTLIMKEHDDDSLVWPANHGSLSLLLFGVFGIGFRVGCFGIWLRVLD